MSIYDLSTGIYITYLFHSLVHSQILSSLDEEHVLSFIISPNCDPLGLTEGAHHQYLWYHHYLI